MSLYESKADAKRKIQALIDSNDKAVPRAILAVYQYQTMCEQSSGHTVEANGVGFSGVDGELLSSFAQQLQRGRTLSEKQMTYARKKIRKYWNQLRFIAERNAELAIKQKFINQARAEGLDP